MEREITIKISEENYEKMEMLKHDFFEDTPYCSDSEFISKAIEFFCSNKENIVFDSIFKGYFRTSALDEVLQSVNSIIHLKKVRRGEELQLESMMNNWCIIKDILDRYTLPEIFELGRLFSFSNRMSEADLIRFKHRVVPEMFLEIMGAWKEIYKDYTDEQLANEIIFYLKDEEFSKNAYDIFPFTKY